MTALSTADLRRMRLSAALDLLTSHAPTETGHPGAWVDLERSGLPTGYLTVLADLLEWLGIVQRQHDTLVLRVVSPLGGYCLRILADLLSQQIPLFEWLGRPSRGLPGRALLAALEQIRLQILTRSGAAPVRELHSVVGLITRQPHRRPRAYLLVFDADAGEWQLPGGRVEVGDRTLRHALLRELSEELGIGALREPHDLHLQALGAPFRRERVSPSLGLLTATLFHPFLVTLHCPPLHLADELPADLYWATAKEIMAGQTLDGQQINKPAIQPLLARVALQTRSEECIAAQAEG